METRHVPVLMDEVISLLMPAPNKNFIDGTFGGGGHTKELLDRSAPHGKVWAFDVDQSAIERGRKRLSDYADRLVLINDNVRNLPAYVKGFSDIHGILLDLGISSDQLSDESRGISFEGSAPLDMRMGGEGITAAKILNTYSEDALTNVFRDYGEERHGKGIAQKIIEYRKTNTLKTTDQLVSIVVDFYKKKPKPKNIHVATKVFQALRIAVNDELRSLEMILPEALSVLAPGGRIAIISFHSLEDRIVKHFFKQAAKGCICPPEIPVCRCGHTPSLKVITKKPILPSEEEVRRNPRSRSAKLRVAEKI